MSLFPGQIDSFTVKKNDPGGDEIRAEHINDLQDSVVAIEETLGTNPQGTFTSVAERLDSLTASGTDDASVDDLVIFNLVRNPRFSRPIIDSLAINEPFPLGNWVAAGTVTFVDDNERGRVIEL